MRQEGRRDKPEWKLLDPDENGLVVMEWTSLEGKVHGFPLGPFDDVAEKLAAWLAKQDFGE